MFFAGLQEGEVPKGQTSYYHITEQRFGLFRGEEESELRITVSKEDFLLAREKGNRGKAENAALTAQRLS